MKSLFSITSSEGAEADLVEIVDWYNDKGVALDIYFFSKYLETRTQILSNPLSGKFVNKIKRIRKKKVEKFPYHIYYKVQQNIIIILAIIHTARSNKHIQQRLK